MRDGRMRPSGGARRGPDEVRRGRNSEIKESQETDVILDGLGEWAEFAGESIGVDSRQKKKALRGSANFGRAGKVHELDAHVPPGFAQTMGFPPSHGCEPKGVEDRWTRLSRL